MYYDLPFMAPVSVEETEEVENALQMSDMEGLPSPSVPASLRYSNQCLRTATKGSRQSDSTQRNTKWRVNLFQGIYLAHLKILSGNLTCL